MATRCWRASGWLLGVMVVSGCGHTTPPAQGPVSTHTGPAAVDSAESKPAAKPAESPTPQGMVSPAVVTLAPGDPGVQLLLSGPASKDATGWQVEPDGVVAVDASGYVTPLAAGVAKVTASGVAPATVTVAPRDDRPWDFAQDVVPILTRAGCNTGNCHGRADGQNGFHLSLFGYDPKGDYEAITRGADGRRITRINAEGSLLITKATGRVPHVGGQRLTPGSTELHTLVRWIEAGAPSVKGKTHGAMTAIRVEPDQVVLDAPGPRQIRVVATYEDGHERDVTRLAAYKIGDDATLSIDGRGKAELLRRGEADLVVRYQSHVISTRLATLINPDLDFDFKTLTPRNFIDEELYKRLASLNVPPSPPASEATFLRRVSLDLTGLQPQPEVIRDFLADADPEKREKLIDRLIGGPEFIAFWNIKFGDLLQITSSRLNNGASYYHAWLKEQLERNTPWDESVRSLLTAVGNPMAVGGGPVNYAMDSPDPKVQAEQTAQRFLALRLRCAQCHDHPFDVWTQDDYYGLAAFFSKVQVSTMSGMGGRSEVKVNPKGQVEHLRTRQPAVPRLLDGTVPTLKEDEDPRKTLADWMTRPENPYFARATANWVWAQFFGKGLADPPDDLSKANPPVHPELLDALARHFVEHKFDLRDLIRTVVTSRAYGASSATVLGNEKDARFFSHQIPRPLTAHQMADALAQATDVPNRFPLKPTGTRAIEVYDPATASTILDTFGRCPRNVGCAAVSSTPLSLRQSLLLMGGDVVESKVSSLNGYLANLLELDPDPEEVVDHLYLRVVCRPPTAEESSRWAAELKQTSSRREAAEDLFWALLNSREFAFNH